MAKPTPCETPHTCCDCAKPLRWAATRCRPCQDASRRCPIPEGFEAYMVDHSQDDAAVHFALSLSTVQRMCKAIGFKRPTGAKTKSSPHRPQHPAPDWFRREASTMTRAEASQRAGVSQSTIDRWMREAGVRCNVLRGFSYRRQNAVPVRMANMSLAGRAADFLRPRWPNHRCDEDGQQNFNGRYWRFGTAVLAADEVIERAKRRGFDADAWMRIAA